MKHPLPPLDSLKAFECAARHLSFSLAAEELCISKGAVSHQIRKLEEQIDCALFKRTVRQVYLTDAGQTLLKTTQKCFGDLTQTFEQVKPHESTHTVTVGATTYVALRWLSPRISQFNQLYPDVFVLLQHWVSPEDFRIQDVDFAIRWCETQGRLTRSRLLELPMPLFPVCSPQLLERYDQSSREHTLPTEALASAPLGDIPLLCEDRQLDLWQHWFEAQSQTLSNPRRVIADANVRTQAAIDGQGWTMADAMMRRELDSGALVAPFRHALEGYGYALETAAGRYLSQDARMLRSWLIDNENSPG